MSKFEIKQMRMSLFKTLLGCMGWILFAICGMQAGWLSDIGGTAILIIGEVAACINLDKYIRKMERRWKI